MSSKAKQRVDWILKRIERIIGEAEERNICNIIEMRALEADAMQLQRILEGRSDSRAARGRPRGSGQSGLSSAQKRSLSRLKKSPQDWHEMDARSGRALVRRGYAKEDPARSGWFRLA